MSAELATQVNGKSFRNATFCGSKSCYYFRLHDSHPTPGKPGNRVTGTRELNRTVLDLDSMALISWLLRWGVVLVTVATKCEEGVSTVWVFPGGERVGVR